MILIYKKYREQINYIIFGILTTIINIISYHLLFNILQCTNLISNILAWILAVIFAYLTNRRFVFKSYSKNIINEVVSFFGCRLLTGLLDIVIMYISVDLLFINGLVMKCFSNAVVIIINYIASKKIIFS